MSDTKHINIPILARVEGEGSLTVEIQQQQIKTLKLSIYEPPRLFEKFLEGRCYTEVLDFVARICGICPVAYQMSAVNALESIFQFTPSPWIEAMRRVYYCGEWIQSHSLHVHLLAAPDFLGYASAIEMAKDHPAEVRRGLRLQQLGNALIKLLGKRSVHPIGACVGGFYHAPAMDEVDALLRQLRAGVADAEQLVRWCAALPLPQGSQQFTSVAVHHSQEYAMTHGDIISDQGLAIPITEFDHHFREYQAPYSTALHCSLHGKPYLVGPLARLNLNHNQLPEQVRQLIDDIGLALPSDNMFYSIVARAIEIYYALTHAIDLLEQYQYSPAPNLPVTVQAGVGYGCTEAPRGMLWHRYELDEQGLVTFSCIVPPTSQNQGRIEEDLKLSLEAFGLQQPDAQLRLQSEMVIRNYDPCISCSTHFLDFRALRD
jgi:coenzyme F420-reducing hydrogenase alpha subunit